jgi:S-adenosylmethionine:tRNA ribosyltransferase-isomerase
VRLTDFDYDLPPDRIAVQPAEPRDSARMLVLSGDALRDRTVRDLPELLEPGDLLVVNDTRVIPARIYGRRATGGKVEVLLLRREPGGLHQALVKAHRRLRPGEVVELDGGLSVELVERPEGGAIWRIRIEPADRLAEVLERHGHVPLPPYIKRADTAADRERYQTVFAARPGSAAAPTAGLHFTPELLERLRERGVGMARVTLHVGYGTFQPVEADEVEDHRMHSEEYEVTEQAARLISNRKGRLIAVGTTSARVLETLARTGGVRAARGNTDLYLYPGRPLRLVEGLLTNFHLPRSSLLLLVSAFAGRERILDAYRHAIDKGYRFYSYGDAMLIL